MTRMIPARRWCHIVLSLALLPFLTSCRATLAVTPESTASELQRCVRDREGRRCYRLISERRRRTLGVDDFEARFLAWSRGERGQPWLSAPPRRELIRSELRLPERRVILHKQGASWLIVEGLFGFFPQATPRAALNSLLSALTSRHAPALLRLMPREFRKHWTAETLARALRQPAMSREVARILRQLTLIGPRRS